MATWLDSITSPLKSAGEAIEKLIEVRDLSKFGDTLRKLHAEVLAAQAGAIAGQTREMELLKSISALEAEVASFETWDTEKQRYELKDIGGGIMAYALKAGAQPPEPAHSICPDCYQQRIKHMIQPVRRTPGMSHVMVCPHCGWEGYVSGMWHPDHGATRSASRRSR